MTHKASDFYLPDQQGKIHKLQDFRGKWVVMFFYPKDSTPGCTKEACSFRDSLEVFTDLNTVILGISKDSITSHQKFAQKHDLPFSLLSDETHKVAKAYGAWSEKKFMGKTYQGMQRNTYIISPQGQVVKSYIKVNPLSHTAQVIEDLTFLQANNS